MNDERARALVASATEPVVLVDAEGQLLAASEPARARRPELAEGRRVPADDALVVLHLAEPLTAYEELRAGFTAAVSHELRTPLARLLALLESAELPGANLGELVERARQEVAQARALIDDVLFLGELESGAAVVTLGTAPALPVLEETAERLAERAARADIRIVARGSSNLELPLRPRMLRVVVENLAENSLRYAGSGATLSLSLAEGNGTVLLTAEDDGAGVAEEDLPRLFERFFRGDRVRASRGTGLGLAIVKHIVTAAGGTVVAEGGPGRGLRIRCVFPR